MARECLRIEKKRELGGRLSRLVRAKEAVAINRVHHVRICTAYARADNTEQRGLPIRTTSTTIPLSNQRQVREKCPNYNVARLDSEFRALRCQIREIVAVPKDKSHPQWCPYCSRVRRIVRSMTFPFHAPNCTRVAVVTRLHDLLVRMRMQCLEMFVNQLLRAAKDLSYRSGCNPCDRFHVVSKFINSFLNEAAYRG
ncbi:hypothetical protein PsorP6_001818 [Peronosclerospora sorghi]|uniref:Uncharacterized protein n=1 Tax=Peronosclerospora sorghi TaxID=230839 RepID=A0ACC0WYM5_9STRA|nr:hypothetical protein PsorP6_001818 [Peronosclerospora sorghi]